MNKYFTKENFVTFLDFIKNKYAKYEDVSLSGLKTMKLSSSDGILNIGEDVIDDIEGSIGMHINQGKYYYCEEPVAKINFFPYRMCDNRIMGEAAIQFKTENTNEVIEVSGGNDWKWFTGSGQIPSFKGNSIYQINLSSDNADTPTIFAEVNSYETINMEEETETQYSSYIKITYNPSDAEFVTANYNWLNKVGEEVIGVLYAADGKNFENVDIANLKKNNKLRKSSENKPIVLFKFDESSMVDFTDLLNNVSFYDFEIKINASRIKCMYRMFYNSSNNYKFNKIDLTGINESNRFFENESCLQQMFVSMFENCSMSGKDDGTKFKLFGKDGDINTGIDTTNATTLSRMFCNGPLTDIHCNPDQPNDDLNDFKNGPNNIFRRLRFDKCQNFSGMFSGCKFNDLTFKHIITNLDWNIRTAISNNEIILDFSNMFEVCPYINGIQLQEIFDLVINLFEYSKATSLDNINKKYVTVLNMDSMFAGCKSMDDLAQFGLNWFQSEPYLREIHMAHIFEGCPRAYNVPIISLITSTEVDNRQLANLFIVDMGYMFANSFTVNSEYELKNTQQWLIRAEDNPNIVISMESMFENCPLYNIKSKKLSLWHQESSINLINEDSYITGSYIYESRIRCVNMFADTSNSSKPFDIDWFMKTGKLSDSTNKNHLPIMEFKGMLDENNAGRINIRGYRPDLSDDRPYALYEVLKNVYANTNIYDNIHTIN